MRTGSEVFRFGRFEFHPEQRRLFRGGEPVAIAEAQLNLVGIFVMHPGEILSVDALADAGWHGEFVTSNNVAQAVSRLRKSLGVQDDGLPVIENVARRGYRFIAPVVRERAARPIIGTDSLLAPYSAFVRGSDALETLDLDEIARARQAFEEALHQAPDYAAAHIGLANACVLMFEATRIDAAPDVESLDESYVHAERACGLEPKSGEAWSTLGFVLHCRGDAEKALAAMQRAIAIEPDEWRHNVRLGFVSWGGARLLASRRLLHMYPGLAFAHWFASTVYIARQRFNEARAESKAGCAAQDAQRQRTDRYNALGVHLLHALTLAECGADDEALDELARELVCEGARHVYARECAANCRYTEGAIHLWHGRGARAAAAFQKALAHVPGHGLAAIGLAAATGCPLDPLPCPTGNIVDAAMVRAAASAIQGRHDEAARICDEALTRAGLLSAGWILSVDPLLRATAHPDAWAQTLALVRHRAA